MEYCKIELIPVGSPACLAVIGREFLTVDEDAKITSSSDFFNHILTALLTMLRR